MYVAVFLGHDSELHRFIYRIRKIRARVHRLSERPGRHADHPIIIGDLPIETTGFLEPIVERIGVLGDLDDFLEICLKQLEIISQRIGELFIDIPAHTAKYNHPAQETIACDTLMPLHDALSQPGSVAATERKTRIQHDETDIVEVIGQSLELSTHHADQFGPLRNGCARKSFNRLGKSERVVYRTVTRNMLSQRQGPLKLSLIHISLPGKRVRKIRYYYTENDTAYEIDIFQDSLQGLILVDVEFTSHVEKENFVAPNWALADITQEKFTAGGVLAGKSYKDIETSLAQYSYEKLLF